MPSPSGGEKHRTGILLSLKQHMASCSRRRGAFLRGPPCASRASTAPVGPGRLGTVPPSPGPGAASPPSPSGSPLPGKPPGAPAFPPPPCDAGLTLSPLSVPPPRLRRTRSPGRTPGPADGTTESSWAASPSARSCLSPPAPLSLCQPEWGVSSSPQSPLRVPGCSVQLQVLGSGALAGAGWSRCLSDPP